VLISWAALIAIHRFGGRPPAVVSLLQVDATQPDQQEHIRASKSVRSCPENGEHRTAKGLVGSEMCGIRQLSKHATEQALLPQAAVLALRVVVNWWSS